MPGAAQHQVQLSAVACVCCYLAEGQTKHCGSKPQRVCLRALMYGIQLSDDLMWDSRALSVSLY